MKKIWCILLCSSLLCTFNLNAQTVPNGMNYQAVVRDMDGQIIANQGVKLQLSLLSKTNSGNIIHYSETHRVKTSPLGLINLVIGEGLILEGEFRTVPWATEEIWIEMAMDDKGGDDLQVFNESRLLTVPYAFHANTANSLVGDEEKSSKEEIANQENYGKNNLSCPTNGCPCRGDYTQLQTFYFGPDGVDIDIYSDVDLNNLIVSFTNVNSGDLLTVDGFGSDGTLATYTFFRVDNAGEVCTTRIYSTCPRNAWPGAKEDLETIGKTYDYFTVFSHTAEEDGYTCTPDDFAGQAWVIGGNVVGPANSRFGTRNNEDVVLITNDTPRGVITTNGDFGLNVDMPTTRLDVGGDVHISETLDVDGATTLNSTLDVDGVTTLNDNLILSKDDESFVASFENTNSGDGDGIQIKLGRTHPAWNGSDFLNVTNPGPEFFDANIETIQGWVQGEPFQFTQLLEFVPAAWVAGTACQLTEQLVESLNDGLGLPFDIAGPINDGLGLPISISVAGADINVVPALPSFGIPAIPDNLGCDFLPSFSPPVLSIFEVDNSLTQENQFLSFVDQDDRQLGAIQAESVPEWFENYFDGVYLVNFLGSVVGIDPLDAAVGAVTEFTNIADAYNSIGVQYTSGHGDYAEWLERKDHKEVISRGDIVAVVGGKITKNLQGAEQVMAVSAYPIVLGNMPPTGEKHLGNNVAFMGQIPVKVVGPVNSGDYILADDKIPGYGKAVAPNDLAVEDTKLIVGRSWETRPEQGPKMVNTLIGVHNGDYFRILKQYEQKFKESEARLESLEAKVDVLTNFMKQSTN